MSRPPHPPQLYNSNYTWRSVQIMKLLVMQLSSPSRHSIPLWSKYSPQHPVLKHPQFVFLPYCQRTLEPYSNYTPCTRNQRQEPRILQVFETFLSSLEPCWSPVYNRLLFFSTFILISSHLYLGLRIGLLPSRLLEYVISHACTKSFFT
jgi:hypothetical protein